MHTMRRFAAILLLMARFSLLALGIAVTVFSLFPLTREKPAWPFVVVGFGMVIGGLGLKRILGLSSYVTAWTGLHKLRRAMVRPGRDRLHGQVDSSWR